MVSAQVRRFPDLAGLSRAAAAALAAVAREVVAKQGVFRLALSGGGTPRALYEALAEGHGGDFPWARTHAFWGDERLVPLDDPASNYRLAREALLDRVPIPNAQVHPFPTGLPAAGAAAAYEATLREVWTGRWPRLDLFLLGLGEDGHTASLFPGSEALAEGKRWVTVGQAPVEPRVRLTLTLPALNQAARVWFLVAGEGKREALRHALAGDLPVEQCPAGGVAPVAGELVWWVDEAAMGEGETEGDQT